MAGWSDIAFDVLEHITSFLPLPDYHRFSAVCKNWRLVANQKSHPPAAQLPWLVLGEDEESRKRRFYSLSEEKHYSIDIPELYGRCIRGSSYGWLFAIDIKTTGILINPFSREVYELPPFPPYNNDGVDWTPFLERVPENYTGGPRNYTFAEMQLLIVYKAILSHDPKERSDFTVIILYGEYNSPAIWRQGDSTWTVIKGRKGAMKDITYMDGNFYVVDGMNRLYVVQLGSDPQMIKVVEPRIMPRLNNQKYLVNFKGAYLLHIERFQTDEQWMTEEFELVEPDLKRKELHLWDDIDGYAIFIGANSPITVDASQFPGCKKDAFYFTDVSDKYSVGCRDLGIFDFVMKTITTFYPTDIVHPPVAAPVWITPNPW